MKNIILQLSLLNQSKQDKLQIKLAQLQEQKNKINQQVEEHQQVIHKLHYDRGQFKQQAYQQKFKNTMLQASDINQVRFTMQQFEHRLKMKLEHQNQLNDEINSVEQEIKNVQYELRRHIVKDEKYQQIYRESNE